MCWSSVLSMLYVTEHKGMAEHMKDRHVLKISNITKVYPGVTALDNVTFEAYGGEVLGLVGVNGAGKSTLMNILGGITTATSGTVSFDDTVLHISSPKDSERAGIGFSHQEPVLFSHMSVAENICMTHLDRMVDYKKIRQTATKYLSFLGSNIDPRTKISDLPIGSRQLVAIARAIYEGGKILLFDEPTSSFTESEKDQLFQVIRTLKQQGIIIFYISHFMDEIEEICDRVVVLRDGQVVMDNTIAAITRQDILRNMISGEIVSQSRKEYEKGQTILKVENLSRRNVLNNISFEIHAGEIVGLWGLMGSGRTELLRAIYGLDRTDSGKISIMNNSGAMVKAKQREIKKYFGFLTESRHDDGIFLPWTIWENITAPNLKQFLLKKVFLNKEKQIAAAEEFSRKVQIKAPNVWNRAEQLSGGNQQKVIIAKWLMHNPRVFLMDEPTRGVDIGAKAEIQKMLREFAERGAGILVVSSELEEISVLSDRLLIIKQGQLVAQLDHTEITKDNIMSYCT